MANPTAYSLLELNQYIRRVISLNFDEPIWIECEIGQASFSRGHWYLDLIQKEENSIVAQCQAAMWANVYYFIKRKSPVAPEEILRQGMAVKLRVNVDYHERYGLKLIIEDIDSSFTIGQLEIQRQEILRQIRDRDMVRKNAGCYLSPVIQRLAVISSARAAGYQDFVRHIEDNVYGYDIRITLFESAMQGQQVEAEMLSCFDEIEDQAGDFDAVAIIRGGGGRTDLAAFDNLPLAIRLALFPLPVLVGIGHEIDQSVLDIVAYQSLKTPTAVADFIVEHNADFENRLTEISDALKGEVYHRLELEHERLTTLTHQLHHSVRSRVLMEYNTLANQKQLLVYASRHQVGRQRQRLEYIQSMLKAIDPDLVLARGYSITSYEGATVTAAKQLKPGMQIQTTFKDGQIKSKVE